MILTYTTILYNITSIQALAHSRTTFEARGGEASSKTFIRKNVIEVKRSTVDFKSRSLA